MDGRARGRALRTLALCAGSVLALEMTWSPARRRRPLRSPTKAPCGFHREADFGRQVEELVVTGSSEGGNSVAPIRARRN